MSQDPNINLTSKSSISSLFHNSIGVHLQTNITPDGSVHSFCGLKLTNFITQQPGTSSGIRSTKYPKRAALHSTGVQISYHNLGPPSTKCPHCQAYMWLQERSKKANKVANPTFSTCCQDGKVRLPQFKHAPPPLNRLLDFNDPKTSKFRDQIRIYNGMFCFTSFGAKIDHSINQGRGTYTFRINGQNYHKMGSLLPQPGVHPKFSQLYFFDTGNETTNRMTSFIDKKTTDGPEEAIVTSLIHMLDEFSSVAKAFRMARDWCNQNRSYDFQLRLLGQRTNSRQYNAPTVSEVAVLITNDFGDANETRDIIVNNKDTGPKRISELHPSYMALQYPLLFPYGEDGFHDKIPYHSNTGKRKTNREFLTMREYYCYITQYRDNEGTTLLRGGRLYQQFLVDAYTAIEEHRLRWTRANQSDLRVDLYHNLYDAVTKGDTRADAIGQRIVLPSSFTGSPRYMMQNYQDAMALCRTYGNPDLFITFTSNPKWPEINEMLRHIPGQKPNDRPEVGTRVFKMKLTNLLDDITQNQCFGKSEAVVYVIEFQKRGLPHAHILLWLEDMYKCKTPGEIDDIISAEIPSPTRDPEGFKAITEFMLHGPCGTRTNNASCTVDGKCGKHYPKLFYAETTIDDDGYPVYRRRKNGLFTIKGKHTYDNSYVVPYNRYPLLKYHAHINVEWCNRSKAIKYLFKYLNKGPDRATIVVQENVTSESGRDKIVAVDEIQNYLDCRFLAPCEAVWLIHRYDINHCYPSVMKLIFHLPNQQTVTLRDSKSLPELLGRECIKTTMFTGWFELNKRDVDANELTYAQLPTKYVWHEDIRMWKKRKQRTCIGRIIYCHPTAGERYYLRMLLNVVKGATSYKKIRSHNDTVYLTFKEACCAWGLISDDKEWTQAILEASFWASGTQLRDLFVTILLFCDLSSPRRLWDQTWEAISEDILYKKRKQFRYPALVLTDEQTQNYCLLELQELLHKNGKSLSDFQDLPEPDPTLLTNMDNRLIRDELSYNMQQLKDEHEKLHASLNPDQRIIYNKVISSVQQKQENFSLFTDQEALGKHSCTRQSSPE